MRAAMAFSLVRPGALRYPDKVAPPRKREIRTCARSGCDTQFEVRPSEKKRFCSMACSHQSEAVLQGLRAGHEKQRTDPHPQSAEARAKMRAVQRPRGEDHHNWSAEPSYFAVHFWAHKNFVDPGFCYYCKRSD